MILGPVVVALRRASRYTQGMQDEPSQDTGPKAVADAEPAPLIDPRTGEPKRGILGLYQRLEDLMGQGAVASLLIFFCFMIFAAWQILSL